MKFNPTPLIRSNLYGPLVAVQWGSTVPLYLHVSSLLTPLNPYKVQNIIIFVNCSSNKNGIACTDVTG